MVQNAKEMLDFVLSGIELGDQVMDGLSFNDLGKFFEVAKKAKPAFKDARLALEEYVKASEADVKELEDFVVSEFDVRDDRVEAVIEQAFKVLIELHALAGFLVK